MGSAIEIILEYLRRNDFTMAESALKEEVISRQGVCDHSPTLKDNFHKELTMRLCLFQDALHKTEVDGLLPVQDSSVSELQGLHQIGDNSREGFRFLQEWPKFPPEKFFCVESEPEKVRHRKANSTIAVVSGEDEISQQGRKELVPVNHTFPRESESVSDSGRTSVFQYRSGLQVESHNVGTKNVFQDVAVRRQSGDPEPWQSLPAMEFGWPQNDEKRSQLQESSQQLQADDLLKEHVSDTKVQSLGRPSNVFEGDISGIKSGNQLHQFDDSTMVQKKKGAGYFKEFHSQTDSCLLDSLEDTTKTPSNEIDKGRSLAGIDGSDCLQNDSAANFGLSHLKTPLPDTCVYSSACNGNRSYTIPQFVAESAGNTGGLDFTQHGNKQIQITRTNNRETGEGSQEVIERQRHGDFVHNIGVHDLSFGNNVFVCSNEELPRLAPVRLHSLDKNVESSKEGSTTANSTRSFESAFRSLGSTPEGTFELGTFSDTPIGQDVSSSGFKHVLARPSVSQGIVEDISEPLSGFATAGEGMSESARDYPDDYWDSDTYEDDDDPGYLRQPILDEVWFLAHEIDYPSQEEKVGNDAENNHNVCKEFGKVYHNEHSFVEEDSYFSGEEYYICKQPEQKDECGGKQLMHSLLCTSNDINITSLRGDGSGENNGKLVRYEGLSLHRPEVSCKAFVGQNNKLGVQGGESVLCDDDRSLEADDGYRASVQSVCVGSDIRDSLLREGSEGDTESFQDQELVAYGSNHCGFGQNSCSQERLGGKEGRHREVKSGRVRYLDDDEDNRNMISRFYNESWCHKKCSADKKVIKREDLEQAIMSNKSVGSCDQIVVKIKDEQVSGVFGFGGFSFPSPSSIGDVAVSRADSGKSPWSTGDSFAHGEESDENGDNMVSPDDTLTAWMSRSNESSPIISSRDERLLTMNFPNCSNLYVHSTDEYTGMQEREDRREEQDAVQIQRNGEALAADSEDATVLQEQIRRLETNVDEYEILDLRIVHRKNRTGFEEDKDFPVVINSVIAGRYHVTEYLGSAAFSKAIQAHDLHSGIDVCMKIIKNNKDFFDQSLDEIKLLKLVNRHDPADKCHILRLYDYFYHCEHLFIVCELLRANLYEFHKFNRESGGPVYFTMPRLQSIARQCLEALQFLHSLGLIHCDLKPENILVKSYSRCEIKVIDLGSSCFETDHLCSYVQSRSYRAPEVILGLPYCQKIDIWSLGCILAELCSGNVLFQNDSLATLLARVIGILGLIDPEMLTKGCDTYKYFTKSHMLYERNQENGQLEYLLPKRTSLAHRLPLGDQGFVEFVDHLLAVNPANRPTATEALKHPWLSYSYEPISS